MLTAEIIRGLNKCGCAACNAAYVAALQEDALVEELREEMNFAGLDIVESIEAGVAMRAAVLA